MTDMDEGELDRLEGLWRASHIPEVGVDAIEEFAAGMVDVFPALLAAARALPAERRAREEAERERDALQRYADDTQRILADPAAVRINLLQGLIAKPDDLVFFHDTHGPVAERVARAVAEEREAAAEVAENAYYRARRETNPPSDPVDAWEKACSGIAAAIRALPLDPAKEG